MKITRHICEVYESISREEMASMSAPTIFDFIQSICASLRAKEVEIELQHIHIERLQETVRVRGCAIRRLDAQLANIK